jgi:hypothetical protein
MDVNAVIRLAQETMLSADHDYYLDRPSTFSVESITFDGCIRLALTAAASAGYTRLRFVDLTGERTQSEWVCEVESPFASARLPELLERCREAVQVIPERAAKEDDAIITELADAFTKTLVEECLRSPTQSLLHVCAAFAELALRYALEVDDIARDDHTIWSSDLPITGPDLRS